MAHKVARLERKKIFNKPHLISAESLEDVVEYLHSRPDGMLTKEELAVAREIRREKKKNRLGERDVAVIPVSGVLSYEETFFGALCGMSSYQGIKSMMDQAVDEGYSTVVLDVDSGGGEAYGTFETAKYLRKLANENDIKLIAYVDGISASAAYGLSVAADEIILNPYAEVGSVGVVTKLENDSEKMKKEGIKRTYVYAGDNKIPFDSEGEWREDFLAELQEKVDSLYESFVTHVSEMRGIDSQVVRDTQAKMFSSDKAIELGLADKVMDTMEFAEYLANLGEGEDMPLNFLNKDKEEKMSKDVEKSEATVEQPAPQASQDNTELLNTVQALQAQLEELQAEKQAMLKAKEEEAKASFAKELGNFSFVSETLVAELSEALYGLEQGKRDVVMAVFAAADEALEEAVTTVVAEEEENEIVLTTDAAAAKEATRAAIEKKYAK